MRIWTLHPRYLDAKGLVALWREGLLAAKVLQGATRGYRQHPQLVRFRGAPDPNAAIATYLFGVLHEATERGYAFNPQKISAPQIPVSLNETDGQLLYEWEHLKHKLQRRDPERFERCHAISMPEPHPLFQIVPGEIQSWERVQ